MKTSSIRILFFAALAILSLAGCRDKGRMVDPTFDTAHVKMDQRQHHFGVVTDADPVVEHDFQLINDGGTPLQITNVVNHCSCTHVEYPQEPIKPGHGVTLQVYLNVADLGYGEFVRAIDLSTNVGTVNISLMGEKH
jgi:hypothetical protein